MAKAPKKIYLQLDEDRDLSTWCVDKIHANDIVYIRADLCDLNKKTKNK